MTKLFWPKTNLTCIMFGRVPKYLHFSSTSPPLHVVDMMSTIHPSYKKWGIRTKFSLHPGGSVKRFQSKSVSWGSPPGRAVIFKEQHAQHLSGLQSISYQPFLQSRVLAYTAAHSANYLPQKECDRKWPTTCWSSNWRTTWRYSIKQPRAIWRWQWDT